MEQKKSKKELEQLADELAVFNIIGRRQVGKVGDFTIGREVFGDLKSEDIAQRRPANNSGLNLNGKPRRGRYSKTIGKK